LESLYREIDNYDRKKQGNIIIVTHGLFMRFFVMRYFKMSIEKFERMSNPENCEIWLLEKNEKGKYELKSEIKEDEKSHA
jgi:broad specificity phosphatase PhoE